MPEIVQSNFVDIDVIDDDAALYRFNHAEERDGHGRLAGARATHHSHLQIEQKNALVSLRLFHRWRQILNVVFDVTLKTTVHLLYE